MHTADRLELRPASVQCAEMNLPACQDLSTWQTKYIR